MSAAMNSLFIMTLMPWEVVPTSVRLKKQLWLYTGYSRQMSSPSFLTKSSSSQVPWQPRAQMKIILSFGTPASNSSSRTMWAISLMGVGRVLSSNTMQADFLPFAISYIGSQPMGESIFAFSSS